MKPIYPAFIDEPSRPDIIVSMDIRGLGEFGLIERIAKIVGAVPDDKLVLGIGDDAAVWMDGGDVYLVTTDSMVQDVHFSFQDATWHELGWKALAINISDIAAMGGIPRYALISLCLPPDTEVYLIDELCYGFKEIDDEFHIQIIGGNISSAPVVIINVTIFGTAPSGLLTRSTAVAGDLIAVTGYLGQSAAGFTMMKSGIKFNHQISSYLKNAHLRPQPRVIEGQILVKNGIKTAIDISDGLLSDIRHVARASGVAARIWADKLPIHHNVKQSFGEEFLKFALSGGEDYELLFTGSPAIMNKVSNIMSTKITVIGEIVQGNAGDIALLDMNGRIMEFNNSDWEHFKANKQ